MAIIPKLIEVETQHEYLVYVRWEDGQTGGKRRYDTLTEALEEADKMKRNGWNCPPGVRIEIAEVTRVIRKVEWEGGEA